MFNIDLESNIIPSSFISSCFYYTNYYLISIKEQINVPVQHFWSYSLLLQLYLLFPLYVRLICYLCKSNIKQMLFINLCMIIWNLFYVLNYTFNHLDNNTMIYYTIQSHSYQFLMGCTAQLYVLYKNNDQVAIRSSFNQ